MGSCLIKNLNIPDAFAAEALAAVQALDFAADLGHQRIELEGDALGIIRKLRSDRNDRYLVSAYITNAKVLLRSFNSIKLLHVHRDSNKLADLLAEEAVRCAHHLFMMEEIPEVVVRQAAIDRRNLDLP